MSTFTMANSNSKSAGIVAGPSVNLNSLATPTENQYAHIGMHIRVTNAGNAEDMA
jgi:hypothetical protein